MLRCALPAPACGRPELTARVHATPYMCADATGPVLTDLATTSSSVKVTASGTSSEAGVVYCVFEPSGQTIPAAKAGASDSIAEAGSFSTVESGAVPSGYSAYCVGEDSFGNLGEVVEHPFNTPPTDITLSAETVAENVAEGTDIGALTTTDPDAGDTFTYAITSQSVVDALKISGDKLQVGSGVVDFEATPSISVTVRSADSGSATVDKTFTITVTDVNEAPSSVAVSGDTVLEKSAEGTDVGTLTAVDPDAGDLFTYAIASQSVAGAFKVTGDKLQVGTAGASLAEDAVVTVTVEATDAGGLTVSRDVDIVVTKDSANLATLGIITAGLVVVAGFSFAFYKRGAAAPAEGADTMSSQA